MKMGEFVLLYEAMRLSADPDSTLLEFLESTYDGAANCGHWDRLALEVATKAVASYVTLKTRILMTLKCAPQRRKERVHADFQSVWMSASEIDS